MLRRRLLPRLRRKKSKQDRISNDEHGMSNDEAKKKRKY